MRKAFTPLLALLLLLVAFGSPADAQWNKARAKLYSRADAGEVQVAIEIDIDRGWHLYHTELGPDDAVGQPTVVTLEAEGVEWSQVRFPEPHRYEQPGIGKDGRDTWIYGHDGRIVLYALGSYEGDAPGEITADLAGLTCEDSGSCVPYGDKLKDLGAGKDALFADFPGGLVPGEEPVVEAEEPEVVVSVGRADVDYGAVTFPSFEPQSEVAEHGLGVWLLLALLAGAILNVMPCVLPVISIKVLSFVQQAGEDRRRIFQLGLAFAAGIVVVFEVLAAVAVILGLGWGEQFQSDTFLIVMIGVVFALALSLFGLYELGVPRQVGGLAAGQREGLADAFFKGMLATILATPCSGPFLGSTLTWTLSQPATSVFLIFTALGVGMALPYILLTANPALINKLPKPGPWMETFKHSMGFVLMATVVYLMISLRQDLLVFTVAFLVFVALGCWWWGRFVRFDQSTVKRFAHLGAAVLIVLLGAQFSFGNLKGAFHGAGGGGEFWEEFDPDRFQAYLDDGQSVFVDFTADWCPNCKWNEKFVYETESVRGALDSKGVVALKADITHKNEYTAMLVRLRESLGARSIPFMALFPGDDPLRPHVRYDIVDQEDLLGVIDSLP